MGFLGGCAAATANDPSQWAARYHKQGVTSQQLTDDKPLWFKDKFSTIVEVNVTFMCLETAGSTIVRVAALSPPVKTRLWDMLEPFRKVSAT